MIFIVIYFAKNNIIPRIIKINTMSKSIFVNDGFTPIVLSADRNILEKDEYSPSDATLTSSNGRISAKPIPSNNVAKRDTKINR
jgi:hypothetical protein